MGIKQILCYFGLHVSGLFLSLQRPGGSIRSLYPLSGPQPNYTGQMDYMQQKRHWQLRPFQCPIRRFIIRYQKGSNTRDFVLKSVYCLEIWQASWQPCCQISKGLENVEYQFHTFFDLWGFTIRRRMRYQRGVGAILYGVHCWSYYSICNHVIFKFNSGVTTRPVFIRFRGLPWALDQRRYKYQKAF